MCIATEAIAVNRLYLGIEQDIRLSLTFLPKHQLVINTFNKSIVKPDPVARCTHGIASVMSTSC